MIKFLIVLLAGFITLILCKVKSEYRVQITACFLFALIVMNVLYNYRTIGKLIHHNKTFNQLIYQSEYEETKEYADAFLNLLIDGKKIYTKKDIATYYDCEQILGFNWLYSVFHYYAPTAYLEHYSGEVIQDEMMNNSVINEKLRLDFNDIGFANDMLRNVCMYHPDQTEASNYFHHYKYYHEIVGPMHVFVNLDGILESDELVLIWQNQMDNGKMVETEDLYLMTKDYYDRNIRTD